MSRHEEDFIWAIQRAINLLRADVPYGALSLLPAGGDRCEKLVYLALEGLKGVLDPDEMPAPVERPDEPYNL